jgi:hypothetical protein
MLKLYNLGCSFARGNCASDLNKITDFNLSPGSMLAEYLNREEINWARNGNSLDGVLKDLYSNEFEKDSIILIGTPPPHRFYILTDNVYPQNPDRIGKGNKSFSLFKNKDAKYTIEQAFRKGPVRKEENKFVSLKWDEVRDRVFESEVNLVEFMNFRFVLTLLSIQSRLRELNLNYILYNGIADLNFESKNWEVKKMKNMIDLTYYYDPTHNINDATIAHEKYRVSFDDTHPNHVYYRQWFEQFKLWLEKEKFPWL